MGPGALKSGQSRVISFIFHDLVGRKAPDFIALLIRESVRFFQSSFILTFFQDSAPNLCLANLLFFPPPAVLPDAASIHPPATTNPRRGPRLCLTVGLHFS